jgi:hypothetical protein
LSALTADDWGWTCARHGARGRGDGCPLCKRDRDLTADLAAQVQALASVQAQILALATQVRLLTDQVEQMRRLLAATNVRA